MITLKLLVGVALFIVAVIWICLIAAGLFLFLACMDSNDSNAGKGMVAALLLLLFAAVIFTLCLDASVYVKPYLVQLYGQ